jgi:L-alanine-DL-glutamate epimerase-like enolase superfamily enzyme
MIISRLTTRVVEIPFEKPIKTAIHDIRSVGCVLLTIETDEGIQGESYLFALNAIRIKAFDEMIKGFAPHLIGKDPHFIEAIWQDIWREINPTGHKGVTVSALSTIDTALWDIIGKAVNLPLHKVFGACRSKIKTYASGGLWLAQSIDELIEEAHDFLQQGHTSMKIRLGSKDFRVDVERVRQLRLAMGPEVELMADLNQSSTPKHAIKLGKELQEFDLLWLEEPVPAYDLVGHSEVRQALDIPIASGETEYTRYGMRAMIEAKACDILMPDLQRIGGLSEMRKVAHLAEAYNLPISTHIFTEQSLCIAGSVENCTSIEHMPWYAPLFNEKISIVEGCIDIPERPGLGFTFDEKAIGKLH